MPATAYALIRQLLCHPTEWGFYTPKLTTVRQQTEQMATDCVKILLDTIDGAPSRHLTIPYDLTIYESVKRLNAEMKEDSKSCEAVES